MSNYRGYEESAEIEEYRYYCSKKAEIEALLWKRIPVYPSESQ
ncbi:MAG: hypothetical protein BAJATHORv1_70088 [Candidatus Thorarchaeota archaeon]|nr:MAG: hypothetical protein BAJATHORv1_70088 [Candidatus Thorarchaeota archaeon]